MFTRPFVYLLGAICLALIVATPVWAEMNFDGAVVNSGDGQLVLSVENEQTTFVVNDETKIMLDGKEAKLSDIQAGFKAKIVAEQDGDQWVAKSIEAQANQ